VCKEPNNFYGHNLIGKKNSSTLTLAQILSHMPVLITILCCLLVLIASIGKHHEDAEEEASQYPATFGYSLTALITCLSGSHIHRTQARHLLKISRDETEQLHSIGTLGLSVSCTFECYSHRDLLD